MEATYTNKNSDPLNALSTFSVRASQNDKELTYISDINGDKVYLIGEINDGQNISVNYVFVLNVVLQ